MSSSLANAVESGSSWRETLSRGELGRVVGATRSGRDPLAELAASYQGTGRVSRTTATTGSRDRA